MFLETKEKTATVQLCESLWYGVTVRRHRADEPPPISNNWAELNALKSWRVVYSDSLIFAYGINLGLWHSEVSSSSSSAA